jgi:hypothetical protein
MVLGGYFMGLILSSHLMAASWAVGLTPNCSLMLDYRERRFAFSGQRAISGRCQTASDDLLFSWNSSENIWRIQFHGNSTVAGAVADVDLDTISKGAVDRWSANETKKILFFMMIHPRGQTFEACDNQIRMMLPPEIGVATHGNSSTVPVSDSNILIYILFATVCWTLGLPRILRREFWSLIST